MGAQNVGYAFLLALIACGGSNSTPDPNKPGVVDANNSDRDDDSLDDQSLRPVDACAGSARPAGWASMAALPKGYLPTLDRSVEESASAATTTKPALLAAWTGRRFVVLENDADGVHAAFYDACSDSWTRGDETSRPAALSQNLGAVALATAKDRVLLWVRGLAGSNASTPDRAYAFDAVANRWSELTVRDRSPDPNGEIVTFLFSAFVERDNHDPSVGANVGSDFVVSEREIVAIPPDPGLATTTAQRNGAVHARVGKTLVVWGGQSPNDPRTGAEQVLTNDGWVFETATGKWRALPVQGALSPRTDPATLVVGTRLLLWGGVTRRALAGGTELAVASDGAWLDVATGQWTSISSEGAPARIRPALAWPGGGASVLWGGFDFGSGGSTPDASGYVLHPPWTALPSAGAPTNTDLSATGVRAYASAAGRVLLVDSQAKAFALEPNAAAWRKVDLEAGPLGKRPTAYRFWSGTHLFLWGGADDHDCPYTAGGGGDPSCVPGGITSFADGASFGID